MKNNTETQKDVQGTETVLVDSFIPGVKMEVKAPSKTAQLTSAKTLEKNLRTLGWLDKELGEHMEKVIFTIKARIIDEL